MLSLRELRQHERLLVTSNGVLTWLADSQAAGEDEKGKGTMAVYLVEYSVGGNRASTKVNATEFKWASTNEVELFKGSKLVARFANVSAVVDSEHVQERETAGPLSYA